MTVGLVLLGLLYALNVIVYYTLRAITVKDTVNV